MPWPRTTLTVAASLFAIVGLAACGPKPQELDDLAHALGQSKPIDELLSRGNNVKALNLGDEAWLTEQRRLLMSVDEAVVKNSVTLSDLAVVNASKQLKEQVEQQTGRVLIRGQESWFRKAFGEATEEVAKDHACQLILDTLAPPSKSPTSSSPDEPLLSQIVDDLVTALEKKAKAPTGGWRAVLDLIEWGSATIDDAEQLADSVQAGTTDLTLLARPPVARAAVAYARLCYSPPKMP
jgi:hypothetical protein